MSEDVYWKKYTERFKTFSPLTEDEQVMEPNLIICIPVCAEPDLLMTLTSLLKCHPVDISIAVILLFNINAFMSGDEIALHNEMCSRYNDWYLKNKNHWISFFGIFVQEMPDAKGGVGWARKLAMDEAARRLGPDGIIVCLDGDCVVDTNYLEEIEKNFRIHSNFDAASIYFEHPYNNNDSDEKNAIIQYELHLRYLVHAQRWCKHPFAFQTVGSSMAVRRNAYLSQGGMNTKMAGEDFYFLQKFIETGRLFEIKSTTVYPSTRISNRVPFGTGKAMSQIKNGKQWMTTNFEIFRKIKPLFESIDQLQTFVLERKSEDVLHHLDGAGQELISYLSKIKFVEEMQSI
ncbi:MAG TPA: glycosyltransferase family 2 protein, partial [Saprospiraceae bacterium]|nr:glycosyltransferase family 2 protein [Saprospiraceae bacterium]